MGSIAKAWHDRKGGSKVECRTPAGQEHHRSARGKESQRRRHDALTDGIPVDQSVRSGIGEIAEEHEYLQSVVDQLPPFGGEVSLASMVTQPQHGELQEHELERLLLTIIYTVIYIILRRE